MNPHEALKMLDSIVSSINLNRADHDRLKEAVQVIAIALSPKEEKKEAK